MKTYHALIRSPRTTPGTRNLKKYPRKLSRMASHRPMRIRSTRSRYHHRVATMKIAVAKHASAPASRAASAWARAERKPGLSTCRTCPEASRTSSV